MRKSNWRWLHTLALVIILFAVVLFYFLFSATSILITWWITMLLLTLFILIIGHGVTGRLIGVLIDERNRLSLSRLQLTTWTIVILSAFITATDWNLINSRSGSLVIVLPPEVWLLLGISTASFVASSLILSNKTKTPANQAEAQRQLASKAQQEDYENDLGVVLHGQVPYNTRPEYANLIDLFQGDEVGNFSNLDISKVQMFLFTLILVVVYAASLYTMFANANPIKGITSFPALDLNLIVLLGISHASYLSFKAVPHSEPPDLIPGLMSASPLEQILEQNLNQAKRWSNVTAITATLGFLMILGGVITTLLGNIIVGLIASVAGSISEITAIFAFLQVRRANKRVDSISERIPGTETTNDSLSVGGIK